MSLLLCIGILILLDESISIIYIYIILLVCSNHIHLHIFAIYVFVLETSQVSNDIFLIFFIYDVFDSILYIISCDENKAVQPASGHGPRKVHFGSTCHICVCFRNISSTKRHFSDIFYIRYVWFYIVHYQLWRKESCSTSQWPWSPESPFWFNMQTNKTYQSFVRGIHRSPVDSPHKGTVMRKESSCHDVIMNPPPRSQ